LYFQTLKQHEAALVDELYSRQQLVHSIDLFLREQQVKLNQTQASLTECQARISASERQLESPVEFDQNSSESQEPQPHKKRKYE